MDASNVPRLVFEQDGQVKHYVPVHDADQGTFSTFTLGRDGDCDFVCQGEYASRLHGRIEFYRNDFFLVDLSTNGTFIQTEDEQVSHVHRNRVRLWGEGWISAGHPLNDGKPIHFRQASGV